MLNSVSQIKGSKVAAIDGEMGHIEHVFFDDEAWAVRYLVVNTGNWLTGREVLVSPYAVNPPIGRDKLVGVALTRQQIKDSPLIDTHQPVSRRQELDYMNYYGYPSYWDGAGLWGVGAYPLMPLPLLTPLDATHEAQRREAAVPLEDVHLRSSAAVAGDDVQAADGSIGHIHDFIFDEATWAIRYLVVDTRNWWPGGKKVLLSTRWIENIEWSEKAVYTLLTRQQVKDSPVYDDTAPIERAYEERLHRAYGRDAYWY